MRHILLIATAIAVGAVTGNIVVRCVLLAAIVILTFGLSWLMQLMGLVQMQYLFGQGVKKTP